MSILVTKGYLTFAFICYGQHKMNHYLFQCCCNISKYSNYYFFEAFVFYLFSLVGAHV